MNTAKNANQIAAEITAILSASIEKNTPAALLASKVKFISENRGIDSAQAIEILASKGASYGGDGELGGVLVTVNADGAHVSTKWADSDDVYFVNLSDMIYSARTGSQPDFVTPDFYKIES